MRSCFTCRPRATGSGQNRRWTRGGRRDWAYWAHILPAIYADRFGTIGVSPRSNGGRRMRHRTFALALGSLALAAPVALADMIPFASRVDAVTVFPAGASVHRVGRARVQAGDHQLVFSALPSELADDTVRIGGFGPGASAEAVSVRSGRLAELTGPEIARLAEQLAATQREQADTARRRDEIVR